MKKKNSKIIKRSLFCRGYVITYNVEILNYFNPELQLKDAEFAIKNKLIKLLPRLKEWEIERLTNYLDMDQTLKI